MYQVGRSNTIKMQFSQAQAVVPSVGPRSVGYIHAIWLLELSKHEVAVVRRVYLRYRPNSVTRSTSGGNSGTGIISRCHPAPSKSPLAAERGSFKQSLGIWRNAALFKALCTGGGGGEPRDIARGIQLHVFVPNPSNPPEPSPASITHFETVRRYKVSVISIPVIQAMNIIPYFITNKDNIAADVHTGDV
ncbi:hypothetical protein QR685DRAFT_544974 [Neurospora intermedia]|uniref:Uncharacterized protein n=1 Tax=Neurospora intermedia TaxID=5142 RepID=A0ABR3D9X8_NEUIN